ncbi:hypothetical protein BC831DRAFT_462041, partial [Entophlyctis helioformis]
MHHNTLVMHALLAATSANAVVGAVAPRHYGTEAARESPVATATLAPREPFVTETPPCSTTLIAAGVASPTSTPTPSVQPTSTKGYGIAYDSPAVITVTAKTPPVAERTQASNLGRVVLETPAAAAAAAAEDGDDCEPDSETPTPLALATPSAGTAGSSSYQRQQAGFNTAPQTPPNTGAYRSSTDAPPLVSSSRANTMSLYMAGVAAILTTLLV